VIESCTVDEDGNPTVNIKDYCRTWLQPFDINNVALLKETEPDASSKLSAVDIRNGDLPKRSFDDAVVSENDADRSSSTTTSKRPRRGEGTQKERLFMSAASKGNDWSSTRVVMDLDQVQMQVQLASKLGVSSTLPPSLDHHNKLITGFGSKIDHVVTKLVELKRQDPNIKSLVFSQWPDALQLVQEALSMNSVSSLIMTGNKAGEVALRRFKGLPSITPEKKAKKVSKRKNKGGKNEVMSDNGEEVEQIDECEGASIQVLLMPLKSTNAGLSISEATHVFLLDTGLNRGLEIQALARVRRLNSTKSTFVHRLITEGTIESVTWDLLSSVELQNKKTAEEEEGENSVINTTDIKRCDVLEMLVKLGELYKGGVDESMPRKFPSLNNTWKENMMSELF
jgi:hypothetical protein